MPLAEASSITALLIALAPTLALVLAVLILARRRLEMQRFEQSHKSRSEAIESGSHKARLLHPDIDLAKCIGCGACVRACPEEGVLDLLHGQAVVVHGARCVGHGRCAEACPTGAIALTFGDLSDRDDLPAINEEFEAVGVPNLFIAGELSGFSLVRTAVSHGTAVADIIARRVAAAPTPPAPGVVDLLIVGVGPAGLACALRATEEGVNYHVIEQADRVGGTVAAYPRRKMIMTQPIQLPLHGRLPKQEYQKEELVELWDGLVAKNSLSIETGVRLIDVVKRDDGLLVANTSAGPRVARHIALCLGRRGSPRKLGIPGEHLTKVAFSLIDVDSYNGRNILVVGGGDSAAEAAIGLCENKKNNVTLCSRAKDWVRVKAKNEARIRKAVEAGHLTLLMESNTKRITEDSVTVLRGSGPTAEEITIPNDEVFILVGGDPPFDLLKRAGVSFDPTKRVTPNVIVDSTGPLLWATGMLLVVAAAMIAWGILHFGYYGSSHALRTLESTHVLLRPAGKFGLAMGLLAVALFSWNLLYLVRRSLRFGRFFPGSLRFWMGTHVFTGLASFLAVIVHAGFSYRATVGGFAFLSLVIVLLAGLVGRYFYAVVPRAANGREIDLDELRARMATLAATWDASARGLGKAVRDRVETLVRQDRWRSFLIARIIELIAAHFRIRRALNDLRHDRAFDDVPNEEREELLQLAKRSYRLTLQITHFEEIRAVLSTWRFIHRWLAILMVAFVVIHIVTALRYARLDWPVPQSWLQTEATP